MYYLNCESYDSFVNRLSCYTINYKIFESLTNTFNFSATDILYCCQEWSLMHCLAMDVLFVAYLWLQDVFTSLLPSSECPSVVGCTSVGTCLPIRFLEVAQSVTISTGHWKVAHSLNISCVRAFIYCRCINTAHQHYYWDLCFVM
jgi:hypothetical protein